MNVSLNGFFVLVVIFLYVNYCVSTKPSLTTTFQTQIVPTEEDECERRVSYKMFTSEEKLNGSSLDFLDTTENPELGECIDVFTLDDKVIDEWERQFKNLTSTDWFNTIDKLGKIAIYFKLYRRYISWPDGRNEGLKKFPDAPVPYHEDIWANCNNRESGKLSNFTACVSYIYNKTQMALAKIFPIDNPSDNTAFGKSLFVGDEKPFEINEENFNIYVDGSSFNFETTAQYLFCWLAMNRLSIMDKLPYCEYGPDKDDKTILDFNRSLSYNGASIPHFLFMNPIYHNNKSFDCAQESFCPDPCCGVPRHSMCNVACDNTNIFDDELREDEAIAHSTNNSMKQKCIVESEFNDDFMGIINNQWNRSCECIEVTDFYDYELGTCLDVDECIFTKCSDDPYNNATGLTNCVNYRGGYKCTCQMGWFFNNLSKKCEEWDMKMLSSLFDDNPQKENKRSKTAQKAGPPL